MTALREVLCITFLGVAAGALLGEGSATHAAAGGVVALIAAVIFYEREG